MVLTVCRNCRTINVGGDLQWGSLAACGKCGHRITVHSNLVPVMAVPLVCDRCGGRNLVEQYVEGQSELFCEDCMSSRECA